MAAFTAAQVSDLIGHIVVITGASSGIGRAASSTLAGRGARVVLAVRDPSKGHTVAADIGGETVARRLDLADLLYPHLRRRLQQPDRRPDQ